jgi:hypothetical protein
MKKIIRLTESDLTQIVKRVIKESHNEIDELDEWIESNTYYISPNSLEEKIKELFNLGDGVSSHTKRLKDNGGDKYGENWDKILITIQNNGDDLFKVWVNNDYEYIYGKNSEEFRGDRFYFNEYAL